MADLLEYSTRSMNAASPPLPVVLFITATGTKDKLGFFFNSILIHLW